MLPLIPILVPVGGALLTYFIRKRSKALKEPRLIVTLGCPKSGKTNYMACSLAYISKYKSDTVTFVGSRYDTASRVANRQSLGELVNLVQESLPKGNWLDKTSDRQEFLFKVQAPGSLSRCTTQKYAEVALHDWPGEAFEQLQDMGAWSLSPQLKAGFLADMAKADFILIMLDVRCLYNEELRHRYIHCLKGLQDELQKTKKKRCFAIALSQADLLEPHKEWRLDENSPSLDVQKIRNAVKAKFWQFFQWCDRCGQYEIWPVSCIPVPEHRIPDPRGDKPSPEWSLADLDHCGQVAPFMWMLDHFFLFRRDWES